MKLTRIASISALALVMVCASYAQSKDKHESHSSSHSTSSRSSDYSNRSSSRSSGSSLIRSSGSHGDSYSRSSGSSDYSRGHSSSGSLFGGYESHSRGESTYRSSGTSSHSSGESFQRSSGADLFGSRSRTTDRSKTSSGVDGTFHSSSGGELFGSRSRTSDSTRTSQNGSGFTRHSSGGVSSAYGDIFGSRSHGTGSGPAHTTGSGSLTNHTLQLNDRRGHTTVVDTTGDQGKHTDSLITGRDRHDFSGRHTYTGYTGNHNQFGGGGSDRRHGGGGTGSTQRSLGDIVLRGDHVHYANDFRHGYHQYDRGWHDSCFHFGFYFFDPIDEECVVSPWYYYPMLPGYVSCRHIFYEVGPRCRWNNWGAEYVYTPSIIYTNDGYISPIGSGYPENNGSNPDLNHAIDEIVNAYQSGDTRILEDVMPKGLSVGIYIDGQYAYNMSSDDYYKMMQDSVTGVKTISYHITNVNVQGNEAQVYAVHEYQTPWGSSATVYQHFKLQRDREGYFVTDFMTSHTP